MGVSSGAYAGGLPQLTSVRVRRARTCGSVGTGLSHEHGVALLCLPPLGGFRLQQRARRAVEEVVLGLVGPQATVAAGASPSHPLTGSFTGRLTPVHPGPVGEEEAADRR